VGAIREDGLAGLIGIGEHRGVDVDDHLVSLSWRARVDAVVEGRLRDEGERIGLLLGHGGRLRGNVPLMQGLTRRGQRLHEDGADLGRQPPSENDHAVLVLIHVQRTALVSSGLRTRLGYPVHPAPAAHDAFDMVRRAGAPDR